MHVILSDAWIRFARTADAELDITVDMGGVLEAVWQLKLERAPVAHVHHRVDARSSFLFPGW